MQTWPGWAWTTATPCSRGHTDPHTHTHTDPHTQDGCKYADTSEPGVSREHRTFPNSSSPAVCTSGVSLQKHFFYSCVDVGECTFCIFKLKKIKLKEEKRRVENTRSRFGCSVNKKGLLFSLFLVPLNSDLSLDANIWKLCVMVCLHFLHAGVFE